MHLLVVSSVFVIECVTEMVDHFSSSLYTSIHSLVDNSIGDKGAVAISEAIKTMTNLKGL